MKRANRFLAILAATTMLISPMSMAIAASSSTPSFSRPPTPSFSAPSFRPSTPSFTKPSTPSFSSQPPINTVKPPITNTAPQTNFGSGFSKPNAAVGSNPTTSSYSKPLNSSPVAAAGQRTMGASTYASYAASRADAKQPPLPIAPAAARANPLYSSYRSSYGGNPNTFMARRAPVYDSYRTNHPTVFVISNNLHPNYGVYDSGFLTGMILGAVGASIIENAAWVRAHQQEAWYAQYRADLDVQAQTNADLRAKLDAMDAEVTRQREINSPLPNATALPSGVDPTLAIAPEAVIADADETHNGSSHVFLWVLGVLLVVSAVGVGFYVGRRR